MTGDHLTVPVRVPIGREPTDDELRGLVQPTAVVTTADVCELRIALRDAAASYANIRRIAAATRPAPSWVQFPGTLEEQLPPLWRELLR